MSHELIKTRSLKDLVQQESWKSRLKDMMGERGPQFAASLVQIVNGSEALQKCEPSSVMGAAITAAALDLSVEPNLGEAHIIPYGDRAQFQIGYKGFIQLAMRSGEYKAFGSTVVYDGQLIQYDELTGELEIDKSKKLSEKVIGYAAKFKLLNGFERGEFWTVDEIEHHAMTYSKSYRFSKGKPEKEKTCLWITRRDEMGIKTVEKSLLNHYGPKSIQLRKALKMDGGAVVDVDSETVSYIDNEDVTTRQPEFKEPAEVRKTTVVSDSGNKASSYNKHKAVKGFLKQAELEEVDLLDALKSLGAIDETVATVDDIPSEVIDMVEEDHESIINDITTKKEKK